jgi:HAD superfamily hydrolase (TIGR01549 family)
MVTRAPLQAVLFDWDGTLLDSYRADGRAYLRMFRALGNLQWDLADLARYYSPDWHNVYRAAKLPQDRWGEADRFWRQFYAEERPALQPDARHVVQTLARRYRLGLVTGGSAWRVRAQLRSFSLGSYFKVQIFADDVSRRKPHPAALQIALRRIGCRPAACVYVGDTPEDVQMARRAGVPVAGVLGHSPVPERLRAARPDVLLGTLAALPAWLDRR